MTTSLHHFICLMVDQLSLLFFRLLMLHIKFSDFTKTRNQIQLSQMIVDYAFGSSIVFN